MDRFGLHCFVEKKYISEESHLIINYCQIFSRIRCVVQFLQPIKANKSCESNKIKKNEFRAIIKHFYMKGDTSKEIKAELDEVHDTSAPSFKTVYNWVDEFKRNRISTRDEPRSGHSVGAAIPGIIEKLHNIILNDRRVEVRKIVEAIDISHCTVTTILHEKLSMKKLSAR